MKMSEKKKRASIRDVFPPNYKPTREEELEGERFVRASKKFEKKYGRHPRNLLELIGFMSEEDFEI